MTLNNIIMLLPLDGITLSDMLPHYSDTIAGWMEADSVTSEKDRPDQDSCTGSAVFHVHDTIDVVLDFTGLHIGEKIFVRPEDVKYREIYYPYVSPYGSQTEWNALTPEEQDSQWDKFHDLCAKGVADDMYFYEVLMADHLVGYVGH